MNLLIKDSKQLSSIINKIAFGTTDISQFVFVSNVIDIPVFSFNHNGANEKTDIVKQHTKLIEYLCETIEDQIDFLPGDFIIGDLTIDYIHVKENYIKFIENLCNRDGVYKDQHDLMYQLTHYTSKIELKLKVGLERDSENENYLKPIFGVSVFLNVENKFDISLNKSIEIETMRLN